MRTLRLTAIAKILNEKVPGITATVEKSWSNTDRKIAGSRLIHPGKGRHGNRIIVKRTRTGEVLIDHDSSETYRSNSEVVDKVKDLFKLDLTRSS